MQTSPFEIPEVFCRGTDGLGQTTSFASSAQKSMIWLKRYHCLIVKARWRNNFRIWTESNTWLNSQVKPLFIGICKQFCKNNAWFSSRKSEMMISFYLRKWLKTRLQKFLPVLAWNKGLATFMAH